MYDKTYAFRIFPLSVEHICFKARKPFRHASLTFESALGSGARFFLRRCGVFLPSSSLSLSLSRVSDTGNRMARSDSGDGRAVKRAAKSILEAATATAATAAYSMRPWDRHASRVSFREKHRGQSMLLYADTTEGARRKEGEDDRGRVMGRTREERASEIDI